jgi:hypothetical protein
LATDRTSSINKSAKKEVQKDIGRAKSQRILKDSSRSNYEKTPSKPQLDCAGATVRKWIDYSSKYGIGYALTNNMIGVYFNDSTKMLACNE